MASNYLNHAIYILHGDADDNVPVSEARTMRKVLLPPESPRGGVLTQGSVLAVTSNPTRTSPVKRGVFVLEAILGTPPAPPPPNIPPLEAAVTPEQLRQMTLRENLAAHASNPICASCHSRMDPLGLALENFNAIGQWRTTDMGHAIDPAGTLVTGESFADIRELKRILATQHQHDFYHNVSEKLLTYALGRGMDHRDTDTLDALTARLVSSGGRPSELIRGIIESAPFQQRRRSDAPAGREVRSSKSEASPVGAGMTNDEFRMTNGDRPAEREVRSSKSEGRRLGVLNHFSVKSSAFSVQRSSPLTPTP